MILVDVNLLVSATMTAAPDHVAAREWLTDRLRGSAQVGLPWLVLAGFVRVATQPRAWERPMSIDQALQVVRSWQSQPCVWVPQPGRDHLDLIAKLLTASPSARLVTDAQLAALCLEHGLELNSRDRDFARWRTLGLRSRDPLA